MDNFWVWLGDVFASIGRRAYSAANYFWEKGDAF